MRRAKPKVRIVQPLGLPHAHSHGKAFRHQTCLQLLRKMLTGSLTVFRIERIPVGADDHFVEAIPPDVGGGQVAGVQQVPDLDAIAGGGHQG